MSVEARVSTIADGNMHFALEDAAYQRPGDAAICQAKFGHNIGVDIGACARLQVYAPDLGDGTGGAVDTSFVEGGVTEPEPQLFTSGAILPKTLGCLATSGDCYTVLIQGSDHYTFGHTGWVEIEEGLVPAMVREMRHLGYASGELQTWIGPGIAQESYRFFTDRVQQLKGKNASFWRRHAKFTADEFRVRLDLLGGLVEQAIESGIPLANIEADRRDTFADPELFSRRASQFNLSNPYPKPRGNHAIVVVPEQ